MIGGLGPDSSSFDSTGADALDLGDSLAHESPPRSWKGRVPPRDHSCLLEHEVALAEVPLPRPRWSCNGQGVSWKVIFAAVVVVGIYTALLCSKRGQFFPSVALWF